MTEPKPMTDERLEELERRVSSAEASLPPKQPLPNNEVRMIRDACVEIRRQREEIGRLLENNNIDERLVALGKQLDSQIADKRRIRDLVRENEALRESQSFEQGKCDRCDHTMTLCQDAVKSLQPYIDEARACREVNYELARTLDLARAAESWESAKAIMNHYVETGKAKSDD